jgi:ligand-binding sensor domain-containing protein
MIKSRPTIFIIVVCMLLADSISLFGIHPVVRNFSRKQSNAGAQNWDITQSENDWMYFANNYGLLEYDGNTWTKYPIKNYTNVRALCYDKNSKRIYAGAFNEFGYYYHNKRGVMDYVSLSEKLTENERKFTEIWSISRKDELIYFQADNAIYRYNSSDIKLFKFEEHINCSAVVHNTFFVSTTKNGISFSNGDLFLPLPNSELLKNKKVCSILPYENNKVLFITDFDGIYLFDSQKVIRFSTDIDDFITRNQVFCAAINKSLLAIGTVRNGLVVKNLTDNSTIYSNTQTGLQNNTILSVTFDRLQNLWLGLDKGIDYVLIHSPIYDLFGNSHLYGAGYTSHLLNNTLYLGTNQGLYKTSYPAINSSTLANVELVNKIRGQVWSLENIDNTLFCGSDNGVFIVSNEGIEQIPGLAGTWGFKPLLKHPGIIIGSAYSGLFILTKKGNKWVLRNRIKGFSESGGGFVEDAQGDIWFSHWMKGLYRLKLNQQLDSVVKTDYFDFHVGLPTNRNNTLFVYQGAVYISTERGFFKFNDVTQRIESAPFFNTLFGIQKYSVKMFESPYNDLLYVSGIQIKSALKQKDGTYKVDSTSFFSLKDKLVPGFEHLTGLDATKMLIATEDGFSVIFKNRLSQKPEPFRVAIRSVLLTNNGDSLVNGFVGKQDKDALPEFDSKHNSVRFEFVGTEYRSENAMLYSFMLENYDSKWSEYSTATIKEFTKLPKGHYSFRVKAKNQFNAHEVEATFHFTILPPWYQSNVAIVIYILFILVAMYYLIHYIQFRSEQGAREMKAIKEQEIKEQEIRYQADAKVKEKEIIALKNQKLQYELRHKSQDLASSTMNLIRKNEILLEINNNLDKISLDVSEKADTLAVVRLIRKMQENIQKNIEHDNNWKKFQENFDLVYEDYLKRLGEQYPSLTVSDKKLCAYLKMDLSSKDIAPLLNMSFRSVEMSRYRLRKKLNLDRDVNLTEFLQKF